MFKLSYAVSPMKVNQGFGANPDYYARFKDSFGQPEKGHMGIDFFAPHGTPLHAPIDGSARYLADEHGGDGIYLKFKDEGKWYEVILWHLCSKEDKQFPIQIPTDGSSVDVKRGQLLGYTDNTGAPFESSGDHLHFGLVPLADDGIRIFHPANGYGGCVDAQPYFDGKYATDSVSTIVQTAADITAHIATLPKDQQIPLIKAMQNVVDNLLAYIKARG